MAWRIVKQPNGLYARFSDIVDSFTHYDMDEGEVIGVCIREGLNAVEAEMKLTRARYDCLLQFPPASQDDPGPPLYRWRDSIGTIRVVHGDEEADEMISLTGGTPELAAEPKKD